MIKLQNSGLSQIESTKRILSNQIDELKFLHKNPRPEVRTDFHNIKAEMLESFKAMQKENYVILSELTEMKELVKKIFHLAVQINYKVRRKLDRGSIGTSPKYGIGSSPKKYKNTSSKLHS